MIQIIEKGTYCLFRTKRLNKILHLNKRTYAWIETPSVGEILVTTRKLHKTDYILSIGNYVVYDVSDEPDFSDQQHLELEVGNGKWQGYLLLSGLPTSEHKRVRIIPTHEVINDSPVMRKQKLDVKEAYYVI